MAKVQGMQLLNRIGFDWFFGCVNRCCSFQAVLLLDQSVFIYGAVGGWGEGGGGLRCV
jgi:hypothetical protein